MHTYYFAVLRLEDISDALIAMSDAENDSHDDEDFIDEQYMGTGRIDRLESSESDLDSLSDGNDESRCSQNWSENSFPPKDMHVMEPSFVSDGPENSDVISYLNQYISDDIVNLIVTKTNQTAVRKTGRTLGLDISECYRYIGITFVMASVNYPFLRMYWEKKWRVAVVADTMCRERFIQLRNSLKFVFDDDIAYETRLQDKFWKVRPLIQRIQQGCRAQKKEPSMSIGEMIIPYGGACTVRQFVPGKQTLAGIKAFVLANSNGLVCDFHICKDTNSENEHTTFRAVEKAVIFLTKSLVPGHVLYFDQFFTTERLADELRNKGIGCTGIIKKKRIPQGARSILSEDNELKEKGKGTTQVVVRCDGKIALTKWYDNKPVTLLSSVEANEETDECQRWCKRLKTYITITRPRAVRQYNSNIVGVDLANKLLAVCPNKYRTRKWTQRLISHMVDLSASNSWLLYKQDQLKNNVPPKQILQLREFKLQLGEALIEAHEESLEIEESEGEDIIRPLRRKKSKALAVALPSKRQRTNQTKHLPMFADRQGRCRHCRVNKTQVMCRSCKIRLCLIRKRNCYQEFHCQ